MVLVVPTNKCVVNSADLWQQSLAAHKRLKGLARAAIGRLLGGFWAAFLTWHRNDFLFFVLPHLRCAVKNTYINPPHIIIAVVYIFICLYFSCPPYCGYRSKYFFCSRTTRTFFFVFAVIFFMDYKIQ